MWTADRVPSGSLVRAKLYLCSDVLMRELTYSCEHFRNGYCVVDLQFHIVWKPVWVGCVFCKLNHSPENPAICL